MVVPTPDLKVAYASVANVHLKGTQNSTDIVAKELWQKRPVLIFIVRRPGCILCRAEALAIMAIKPQLDVLGVDVVAVVHEYIPEEVKAFQDGWWPGPIYFDEGKEFYKAVGSGKLLHYTTWWWWYNPFHVIWARGKDAAKYVKDYNLKGMGRIMGGLMVVNKGDAGLQYCHVERDFGVHAPLLEVVMAVNKAAAAANTPSQ